MIVNAQRLHQLVADGEQRVHRRHGLLKDHGDFVAADGAELLLIHLEQVLAIEENFTRRIERALRGIELKNGHAADGLAAAALAHKAQGFPLFEREGDVPHGVQHRFAVHAEINRQVFDLQQFFLGFHCRPPSSYLVDLGSSASRRPSPTRLMLSAVSAMARPGKIAI